MQNLHDDTFVYLDMDGVISDFDSHIKNFIFPDWDTQKHNLQYQGILPKDSDYFKANKKIYETVLKTKDFWHTIPKMPDADVLVENISNSIGFSNICILTAPLKDPLCEIGKRLWIKNHYPNIKNFICDGKKQEYVGHHKSDKLQLLIDDKWENTNKWNLNGGNSIHHKSVQETINSFLYLLNT